MTGYGAEKNAGAGTEACYGAVNATLLNHTTHKALLFSKTKATYFSPVL
jgi:hypothetical protein